MGDASQGTVLTKPVVLDLSDEPALAAAEREFTAVYHRVRDPHDPELLAAEAKFTGIVKAALAKLARRPAQEKIDSLERQLQTLLTKFLAEQGRKVADQVVAAVEKRRGANKAADPARLRHAFGYEKVILIRHAEKLENSPHLSEAGKEHAQRLAATIPAKYGIPDLVIAAAKDTNSVRCIETAEPLVAKYHLRFEHSIQHGDVERAAAAIRSHPGKLVLVVWPHEDLPALAEALDGKHRAAWPDDDFSTQWEFTLPDTASKAVRAGAIAKTGESGHTAALQPVSGPDLAAERAWFEDAIRNWPLAKDAGEQPRDDHGRFASGGMTAYHASPNDFKEFDENRAGSTTDAGLLGRGIYLTTDGGAIKSTDHKYTVDVHLTNPLQISLPSFSANKADVARQALGLPKTATAEEVTAAARAQGHDGVILDYSPTGYHHQEICAFSRDSVAITNHSAPGEHQPDSRFKMIKGLGLTLAKHDYSCALVLMPQALTDQLIAWTAAHVNPDDIIEREDEAHVTARFGLHTRDAAEVARVVEGFGPVRLALGKTSIFANDDADVLKIDIVSDDLHRLHALLGELAHTDTHPDYHPHLTLAYLKPGSGAKYAGDATFAGRAVAVDSLRFSQSGDDGQKTAIPLSKMAKHDRHPVERITFQGFPISIETKAGSYRVWGKPSDPGGGRTLMIFDYGYIRMSMGEDGDHVDVTIGPNENAPNAYIVQQLDPQTGAPDEQKTYLGFNSVHEVRETFLAHRNDGDKAFGGITTYPVEEFRQKVHETMKRPGAIKAVFTKGTDDEPRDE